MTDYTPKYTETKETISGAVMKAKEIAQVWHSQKTHVNRRPLWVKEEKMKKRKKNVDIQKQKPMSAQEKRTIRRSCGLQFPQRKQILET